MASNFYLEVEDIMCDQGIIHAEFNMETTPFLRINTFGNVRMLFRVIAEVIFPPMIGIYYAYLRNQKLVMQNVRSQLLPSVAAALANHLSRSLSSLQRGIGFPFVRHATGDFAVAHNGTEQQQLYFEPEKCVECQILAGPTDPNDIRADIVFVHGLYGSLKQTWKQGRWNKASRRSVQALAIPRAGRSRSVDPIDPKSSPSHVALRRSVSTPNDQDPLRRHTVDLGSRSRSSVDLDRECAKGDGDSDEPYSACWPRDWLPKDCPDVRIIALNYTSDNYLWRPIWVKRRIRSSMIERSAEMIELLLKLDVGKRPIVWVAHSKGGLFVKQILINAYENKYLQDLYNNTKSIMFYSVPHYGSSLANIHIPLTCRSIEVLEIQRNCNFLQKLHDRFLEILDNRTIPPEIFSFVEMSLTLMGFLYLRIVPLESADPGLGHFWAVSLDHREICKPSSRQCFLYRKLVQLIQEVKDQ